MKPIHSSDEDHIVDAPAGRDDEEHGRERLVATDPNSSSPRTTTTTVVVFGDVQTDDVNKIEP